jgi:sec-independent protein translocase protein TatC
MSEAPPGDREASIWEHIEELAVRLRRIVIAFFIAAAVLSMLPAGRGEFLYVPLIAKFPELIFQHVVPKTVEAFDGRVYNVTVIPTQATESIEILAQALFLLGFIGASPIIAKEIWEYIEPALYPHEKAFAKRYITLFIAAFLFGVFFGIYLVAPLIELMFLKLYPLYVPSEFKNQFLLKVGVAEVVSFALKLGLAFGALFELPIVIYLLLAYGVVDPDMFNETTMKYIFLGTMVLGAIISPDPSGLGMLIIGLSLYIPIYVAVKLGKKRAIERKVAEELKALVES